MIYSPFYLGEEILLSLFSVDKKVGDRNGWPLFVTSGACCKNSQLAETVDVTDTWVGDKKRKMTNRIGVE